MSSEAQDDENSGIRSGVGVEQSWCHRKAGECRRLALLGMPVTCDGHHARGRSVHTLMVRACTWQARTWMLLLLMMMIAMVVRGRGE